MIIIKLVAAGTGFFSGKSKDSYTGWGKNAYGENQFFNRKPFRRDLPTYEKAGETSRIRYLDNIFKRNGELYRLMYSHQPCWLCKRTSLNIRVVKNIYLHQMEVMPPVVNHLNG